MMATPYEQGLASRREPENACRQRAEGGSLADYKAREQAEWLGGQPPPGQDRTLRVFRAVREAGEAIAAGDYVTNSWDYAAQHIEANLGGQGQIVETLAYLDELFPADGPREFWYLPRSLDSLPTAFNTAIADAALQAYQLDVPHKPLTPEELAAGFQQMGRDIPPDLDVWHDEDGHLVKRFYAKRGEGESEVFLLIEAYAQLGQGKVTDLYVCDAQRNELGQRGDTASSPQPAAAAPPAGVKPLDPNP